MKSIFQNTYIQLTIVYTIFIVAIALGFLHKYSLYFNIFALIIAIFGIAILKKDEISGLKINKELFYILFTLAIIFILLFRFIPYINNLIPLGYDSGLYKYAIEHGLSNGDNWVFAVFEPGFLYLMTFLNLFISSNLLLIVVFILFNVFLGITIYYFTKEYFGRSPALIALLIFSLSLVQFKVFTYMYYKNIISLSLILISFIFLKKEKYPYFIISGILIGIFHRPALYIFGLSYLLYTFTSPYKNKKYNFKILRNNILYGIAILAGTLIFYLGKFGPAFFSLIFPVVNSFASPGQSPGTFITLLDYQFSVLFYLPFAILGLFYIIKQRKFDIFFFYTILVASIVYFQLFFFNRFIIFLDLSLIILSALGFSIIIEKKKILGIVIIIALFASAAILQFQASQDVKPLISQTLFQSIQNINIPKSAYIISFSSSYAPYLQGWTNNKIIAPGMFDYDPLNSRAKWEQYWKDLNASEMLSKYKEIYLFIPNQALNNSCYSKVSQNLYKITC